MPSTAPDRRPTLGDVAAAAGVSSATASRALRTTTAAVLVRPGLADRVRQAALDVGYVPIRRTRPAQPAPAGYVVARSSGHHRRVGPALAEAARRNRASHGVTWTVYALVPVTARGGDHA